MLGGERVVKHHVRIEAYGTVDELNAYTGLIRDVVEDHSLRDALYRIQNTLFVAGSLLAGGKNSRMQLPEIDASELRFLETAIDEMERGLPPLKNFILPGGHTYVSYCHLARCLCRRAERKAVLLDEQEQVDPLILSYLNRLSDYFFVLARKVAQDLGVEEVPWKPRG